jgi:uncharacterized coiled-coil protein SlyX
MGQERLDAIETKLAYMERTVTELNIIVSDQEKELGILQNQVDKLKQKVVDLMEESGEDRPSRLPPHY